MKKKQFNFKHIILFNLTLICVCIALNIFNFANTSFYKSIYNLKNNIHSKVRNMIMVFNNKTFGKDYDAIFNENNSLKEEIEKLKIYNDYYLYLEKDVNNLKKLLDITNVYSDFEVINAKVIARESENFYEKVIIDKGAESGIKNGDAVVISDGLIGKVTNVLNNTATVGLTPSGKEKISVSINGIKGVASFYEEDILNVLGLTNYDDVKIGDQVITSGLGNYPSGLIVGTVSDIKNDKTLTGKIIYLKRNLSDINYVAIIRNKI